MELGPQFDTIHFRALQGAQAYFELANPHYFCSIAICLVMRVAFSE